MPKNQHSLFMGKTFSQENAMLFVEVTEMDLVKIGNFLSELRKEHGFTQEQLGEKLGVTNKTVSRWETGTYLPPADILIMLSELYSLTINEILSGQRLSAVEYQEEAEKKLEEVETIKKSQFEMLERISGYTQEQAKTYLLQRLDDELDHEKAMRIVAFEQRIKDECEDKARSHISLAIARLSAETVSEMTVSVVPLPIPLKICGSYRS